MRAVGPGSVGRTAPAAVSYRRSGPPRPGRSGTSTVAQASIGATLAGRLRAVSTYLVSESRTIAAEPQRLFDLVADPAMHPRIDGSGSVREVREGAPARMSLGAKFGMDMKLGAAYKITNTVVEFDEPKVI